MRFPILIGKRGDYNSNVRIILIGNWRILIGKIGILSCCECYFCGMLKIQKYILLMAGLSLAVLILAAADVGTAKMEISTAQTAGIPPTDGSSGCLSGMDQVFEDEQLQQVAFNHFFAEPVVFIAVHQKSTVIFQPCFIPWQPPKA